jgi:hypothetical protein
MRPRSTKSLANQKGGEYLSARGGIMKHYRVYKLAEPQGPIVKGKDVHAADDDQAIQEAKADEDCPVCEVWQGVKKVGSIT